MIEDLKYKFSELFTSQTTTMRDMIQNSVNDALAKRKEDREKKKMSQTKNSGSELSSEIQE